jgi:hypothetical protein
MKIKITESQFNYLMSEQLTGPTMNASSGTYVGTTSSQHDFQSPTAIRQKKLKQSLETIKQQALKRRNEKIATAKKTWNVNTLNQAINWWRTWLADPKTKDRFSKNWKFPLWMTESVFKLYNDALNNLTIKYIYDIHSSTVAYVNRKYPKIVVVNAAYVDKRDPVNIFIHELQHLLFYVKPLHPSQNINKDINIDVNNNTKVFDDLLVGLDGDFETSSNQQKSLESKYEQKMTELRLSDDDKEYFRNAINGLSPETKRYVAGGDYDPNGTEIMSRLSSIRYRLGKKSGEPITLTELGKLGKSDDNSFFAILSIILSNNNSNHIVNQWNQYVKNNPKVPNPNTTNQNTMA